MNKVTLMQLVDETSSHKTISEFIRSRRKLSIAIDAALKQARSDALEEAAKAIEVFTEYGAEAIRTLKEKPNV